MLLVINPASWDGFHTSKIGEGIFLANPNFIARYFPLCHDHLLGYLELEECEGVSGLSN
jgi:hypothetical protein